MLACRTARCVKRTCRSTRVHVEFLDYKEMELMEGMFFFSPFRFSVCSII